MIRIKLNRIKCLKCGDIITSYNRHDFKWCKCHSCAVDGGTSYLKRCGDINEIEDLSEWEGEEDDKIYDKICFLIEKRKAQKLGFSLIKVDDKIIEKFRNTVKNNKNKSDSEVIKKISRNVYSGEEIYKNDYKIVVAYGYLHICYSRKLKIIYNIQNYKPYSKNKCGHINREIKAELNKIYGLEDK